VGLKVGLLPMMDLIDWIFSCLRGTVIGTFRVGKIEEVNKADNRIKSKSLAMFLFFKSVLLACPEARELLLFAFLI